jgi:hypothetical protein
MGRIIRYTATTTRPADVTQYAAGDEISNSATAGSVVRATIDLTGFTRGKILQMGMDITPASSNLVITALNLKALIFKTADAPAAVGDNVTFPVTGAQRRLMVGGFLFDDGGWENPLGAYTASTSGFQETTAMQAVPLATPTLATPWEFAGCFDFGGSLYTARTLTVCLQALATWNPTAVVNTIGMVFDIDVE